MSTTDRRRKYRYVLLNKPYGTLSQFTDPKGRPTLADIGHFARDLYAAGRLDAESEGLLLLTNDNEVKHRLLEPRFAHPRTYLVQVEGIPTEEALEHLRLGVEIEGKRTRPAAVRLLPAEPALPPRPVPIRARKSVPTAWLEITLTEGRNRQVRRMTASVGLPTLRLVRTGILFLRLDAMKPGEWRELDDTEARRLRRELRLPARTSSWKDRSSQGR